MGETNRKMGEGTRVAVSNEELIASGREVTKLSKGFRHISPDESYSGRPKKSANLSRQKKLLQKRF